MRARGSSAAMLLLLFCTTTRSATINGRIARTKKAATSSGTQTIVVNDDVKQPRPEFLLAKDSERINNELLSPMESRNVVRTGLDQQVDQSELVRIDDDRAKDLESIEYALSVMEYEPQKINKKEKRKIMDHHNNADFVVSNIKATKEPAPTIVSSTHYEVPRGIQPKKITLTSKYHPNPSQEGPKPVETRSKPKTTDVEYVYPIPAINKPNKPRIPKNRPLNSQVIPPTEETKVENTPSARITPSYRVAKQKNHENTIDVNVPSTKTIRKKKNRKRLNDKPENKENDYDYTNDEENKRKSKRAGLVAKHDVASRSFSPNRLIRTNQDSNLEKSNIVDLAKSGPSLDSVNKNPRSRSTSSKDRSLNDNPRNPSITFDGKLHERKRTKAKGDPLSSAGKTADHQRFASNGPVPSRRNHQAYEEGEASTEKILYKNESNLGPKASVTSSSQGVYRDAKNPVTASGVDVYENVKQSATPSSQEIYQNVKPSVSNSVIYQTIKTPVVDVDVVDTVETTVAPYPSFTSAKQVYHAPMASTLTDQRLEVSDARPWTPEAKLQSKKRDVEVKVEELKADATSLEGKKSKESKVNEEQEAQGTSVEHQSEPEDEHSGEYVENDRKGQREEKGDTVGDSSQDDERHEVSKGSSGGDEKGKGGGDGSFEKSEGAKREQGHHELEGKKEKKGYESWHKDEKTNKGHHDKEQHSNYYGEEDGKENEDREEGGYHEERQEGEKGEKEAEFDEKGEHQKGYSTKGQHSVHKKDEFEKRTEFFDEFHDEDDLEKDEEFHEEHKSSKGGHEKVGHHDIGDHEEQYGKEVKHEEGKRYLEEKGHKIEEGQDKRYEDEKMHGEKKSQEEKQNWSYKKGDDGGGDEKNHKSHR